MRLLEAATAEAVVEDEVRPGAEEGAGGRGRGTAKDVSRWGRGRVRSGRRRVLLRLAAAAAADGEGCSGLMAMTSRRGFTRDLQSEHDRVLY